MEKKKTKLEDLPASTSSSVALPCLGHGGSSLTWAEDGRGEFVPAAFYEPELSLDREADAKLLLEGLDWAKHGLVKRGLTRLNGAQAAEQRERQLKPGDFAYCPGGKEYVKLERYVPGAGPTAEQPETPVKAP